MASCTFFGHRDTPDSIAPQLRAILHELVSDKGVDTFYIGYQGRFDTLALHEIKILQREYPKLIYSVVLAYIPDPGDNRFSQLETIFPEGIEMVPKRFAICKRNEWMIRNSDYAVTYVTHNWGGAAKFQALALKKNKIVINLA